MYVTFAQLRYLVERAEALWVVLLGSQHAVRATLIEHFFWSDPTKNVTWRTQVELHHQFLAGRIRHEKSNTTFPGVSAVSGTVYPNSYVLLQLTSVVTQKNAPSSTTFLVVVSLHNKLLPAP